MGRHDPSRKSTVEVAQKVLREYQNCSAAVVSPLLLASLIEYASQAREAQILDEAVTWFDQHRPEWGPGTLPTWYVDAKAALTKHVR